MSFLKPAICFASISLVILSCGALEKNINNKAHLDVVEENLENKNKEQDQERVALDQKTSQNLSQAVEEQNTARQQLEEKTETNIKEVVQEQNNARQALQTNIEDSIQQSQQKVFDSLQLSSQAFADYMYENSKSLNERFKEYDDGLRKDLSDDLDSLKNKLNGDISKNKNEILAINKNIDDKINPKITDLVTKHSEQEGKISTANRKMEEIKGEIEARISDVENGIRSDLASLTSENATALKVLTDEKNELQAELEQIATNQETEKAAREGAIETLGEKIKEVEGNINKRVQRLIEGLNNELSALGRNTGEALEKLTDEKNELKAELEQIATNQETEKEARIEAIETVEGKIKAVDEAMVEKLVKLNEDNQEALEKLNRERDQLKDTLTALGEEKDNLMDEMTELKELAEDNKGQIGAILQRLSDMEGQIEKIVLPSPGQADGDSAEALKKNIEDEAKEAVESLEEKAEDLGVEKDDPALQSLKIQVDAYLDAVANVHSVDDIKDIFQKTSSHFEAVKAYLIAYANHVELEMVQNQ